METSRRRRSDRGSAEPGLPTPPQRELLRAALLPDGRAVDAWARWRALGVALDPGSERLLPLVAERLATLDAPTDALLLRAREARQRARFKGVLLLRDASDWVKTLAARGVATLALKGLALALRYYRDFGLRPMDDIDLLVRPDDVPEALACLYALGLEPTERIPMACWPPRPGAPNLGTAAVTHGCGFVTHAPRTPGGRPEPEARQLDLHWAALSTNCTHRADERFWEAATPLELHGGIRTLALSPAHELVHVLGHGLRWNSLPSIRWVADAARVIASGAVDWEAFVVEVEQRGLALGVGPALAHLATYEIAVPAEVVSRVDRLEVRWRDRLRLAHARWPWDQRKPSGVIAFDALRFVEGLPLTEALRRLGRYARFRVAPDGRLCAAPRELYAKLARP